ncbi:hypothetical protein [Halomicronema hongdechloris]|uniref:hypothetical protein n=1 Tax=Halomicronema hongdechloris TaxID=1209493 RepID=UPI00193100B5|nr:hypothetical protein [Halomicronema hongdechloris]
MITSPQAIICPGMHPPELTERFLACLTTDGELWGNIVQILCPDRYPPFSAHALRQGLQACLGEPASAPPIIMLAFSAGVVGATGLAWYWYRSGGQVLALFAVDGWGVPVVGPWDSYRLSHDAFTHHSSLLLGGGAVNFYADPAVAHQDLWQWPDQTWGWQVSTHSHSSTTALSFLRQHLGGYGTAQS